MSVLEKYKEIIDNKFGEVPDLNTDIMQEYNSRLINLFGEMEDRLIEREHLIRMVALTYFAKTNCFILGNRGVAKTYAIELFGNIVKKTKPLWQTLVRHDTKEEEIFGRTYKDEKTGEWKINTKDSLLEADVGLLDEMFKGKGTVLSSLLQVLVDRCYTFGDGNKIKTNLISIFGISNEYPTDHFMKAYVDRFMIWVEVEGIKEDENRIRFLIDDFIKEPIDKSYFTKEDIEFIYDESKKVKTEVNQILRYSKLMQRFQRMDVETSDRKYKGIVHLMQIIAYLNGRASINDSDLFILLNSAWHNKDEKSTVSKFLLQDMFKTKMHIDGLFTKLQKEFSMVETEFKNSLYRFVNHEVIFRGDGQQDQYSAYLNDVKLVIENYQTLNDVFLADVYSIFMDTERIQKELSQNIFIVEKFEGSIVNEHFILFDEWNSKIADSIKVLDEFLNENSELYKYNQNKKNVA